MSKASLSTTYFDGRSPRAQPGSVCIRDDRLIIEGLELQRCVSMSRIGWPERTSHGIRICELPDGATLQHADGPEWDQWWRQNGHTDSAVVRWMQSRRATLTAAMACVALLVAGWIWGIPLATTLLVRTLPASVEAAIGERAFRDFERLMLGASTVPEAQQAEIRQRFSSMVEQAYRQGDAPDWTLEFRTASALGANAFALPGGIIVVTDELMDLLIGRDDVFFGVLAHELGHVRYRHGMHMVVRASLSGALASLVLGDVSTLLATVPVVLLNQAYSRDAERQADEEAARVLHSNGTSPSIMAELFELLRKAPARAETAESSDHKVTRLGIALSSHPADAERQRFFREWRAVSERNDGDAR